VAANFHQESLPAGELPSREKNTHEMFTRIRLPADQLRCFPTFFLPAPRPRFNSYLRVVFQFIYLFTSK